MAEETFYSQPESIMLEAILEKGDQTDTWMERHIEALTYALNKSCLSNKRLRLANGLEGSGRYTPLAVVKQTKEALRMAISTTTNLTQDIVFKIMDQVMTYEPNAYEQYSVHVTEGNAQQTHPKYTLVK
jgi:hypothetical protein